jgi:hypothetical protein
LRRLLLLKVRLSLAEVSERSSVRALCTSHVLGHAWLVDDSSESMRYVFAARVEDSLF